MPLAVMVLGGPPPGRLVPELLAASGCLPPLMLSLECRRGLCEPPPRSRGCTVDPDLARSPLLTACQLTHTACQPGEFPIKPHYGQVQAAVRHKQTLPTPGVVPVVEEAATISHQCCQLSADKALEARSTARPNRTLGETVRKA